MRDEVTQKFLARVGKVTLVFVGVAASVAAAIFIGPYAAVFAFIQRNIGDMNAYFQGSGGEILANLLNGAIAGVGLAIAAVPWAAVVGIIVAIVLAIFDR